MYCGQCDYSQNGKCICKGACPYGADDVAKYLTEKTKEELRKKGYYVE